MLLLAGLAAVRCKHSGACGVYLNENSTRWRRADGGGPEPGMGVADEQDHDLVHCPGSGRRGRGARPTGGGAGGRLAGRGGRLVGQGGRGARPGGTEHGRGRRGQLGVVPLGGQLRGRRVLQPPRLSPGGVRGDRAARPLGKGDRGARPGGPEQERGRGHLSVVRIGGQLRGRRGLPGRGRHQSGVRGQREARRVGPGDRGARPRGPEQGPSRLRPLGVVRLGGQLRGRRELLRRQWPAGVRGRGEERRLGPGCRGARPGGPEHGRRRRCLLGVVCLGGQLRGRRVLY